MRRFTGWWHLLAAAALSLAGVGAGHAVEYVLVAPKSHDRHELLAHTGHQYLPLAQRSVAFLGLATLAAVFLAALTAGSKRVARHQRVRWALVLPLAQPLAFSALEVGERLAAHASLAGLGTVLLVGLPLQVAFGLLGAALVAALDRAGERLGRSLRKTAADRPSRCSAPPPTIASTPGSSVLWALAPTRGPPSLVVT